MFLSISTTHVPADELGYLLHKHPGRAQSAELAVGRAHVFYPEVSAQRCTAALLLDVDAVALSRNLRRGGSMAQYVNDRPYAASSLLAVALRAVFGTALAGRCAARPELAATPIPLEIHLPAVSCRGEAGLPQRLFGPLGWTVAATPIALDPTWPGWGDSPYVDLRLTGTLRLADALTHLYVLLPVLDGSKHYWVGADEVDKLLRAAGGWLPAHPERTLITSRYLARDRELVLTAVGRLAEIDGARPEDLDDAVDPPEAGPPDADVPVDRPPSLAAQRRGAVLSVLRSAGAASVLDLGCSEGALLRDLLGDRAFTRIVGVDVSARALELAARRLKLDRRSEHERDRLSLLQGSLTYRDARLAGFDAAVLMEVIEHVDVPRLPTLARVVFGHARPGTVVVTTPNAEHNVRFETLPAGTRRHRDHRFEWTRPQFRDWASGVAQDFGYAVRHLPVGPDDPEVGPPTQLAVFTRDGAG